MNNYNHQYTNLTSSAINQAKINSSLSLTSPGCPHPQHQRTATTDQCDQKTWQPISEKLNRESQDHLQQAESPTVLVDHISIGSESPSSSTDTIGMPIGEPIDKIKQQPAHYGSSSTSFSNDSSNLTTCSFGTSNYPLDQSSTASSSGVATFESASQMSSTDHLATITSMSRNSPENNTPTMTLTGGIPLELRDPLIINVAPTVASPKDAVVDSSIAMAATTISSLSLNSTSSIASSNQQAKQRHTNDTGSEIIGNSIARVDSSPFFLHTSGQTQSTPSLLWGINTAGENGVANASEAKSAAAPGSNLSMRRQKAKTVGEVQAQEKQQNGNHECSPQRQHTESSPTSAMTPMTVITTTIENPISTSTIPSASPSSSHYSILGSSPLPSVFNCAATSCSQIICTPLRTIVSQNRRRYQMDGFNLDLTYITDRIIAMGYPADTKEALYRNSMSHIVKFLEHYHPGHYKVFNLRGQYVYDPANFHNRVVSFEMTDHHPPRLELMAPFCREVHDYLDADPLNVVAVHCKAGKGRTGVMICAYLCYISFYRTPRQNMDYYSIIRTHNNKGVTIPSQRRYVYYFAHLRERKLNYMPLRCELVGVYLERPPKLTGPFSKGALKLRVACGDVDVFMGDDMWLDGEKYEEEEELHKRHPLMTASGEDHYDPVHPDPAKNCISRRCYGWTVPENKRVFLEGDIRVDIFLRTRLKLFNVKQERKKIGHIWFNTMFTCPGFCGGQYVHGDEAYPYPDSMIVRRHFKRKQKNETGREANAGAKDNLQPADSPTSNLQHPASSPAIISAAHSDNCLTADGTEREKIGAKVKSSIGAQLTKKRSTRSPCRSLIEPESKSWQSHDGEFSQSASSSEKPKSSRKQCRTSLDTTESEYEHEIVVDKPPGLDQHCSAESLRGIYPNEKMAPRQGIEEMIREAFQKNLVNDMYNVRRMSQPRDGPLIPKAPVGRPNANGPCCLMRMPDEHVSTFGVQEIDRAYKNKDIDLAFKVFIVTRCINESNQSDIRLAEQFVRITHQKQAQKDADKRAKMHQKQRKLMATQQQTMSAQQRCGVESNAAAEQQPSCSSQTVPDLGVENVELTEDCATPLSPDQKPFVSDPRLSDPHLSKYFFRQRVTSHSRHPNLHHHCSLRAPDPKICAKFGCKGNERLARTPTVKSSKLAVPNQPDIPDDECGMLADVEDDDAKSFDDFDFFHPRQQTCSTVRDVDLNNKSSDPNSLAAAHSHEDVPLIDQQPTTTAGDEPNGRQTSAVGSSSNLRTAAPMRSPTGKDSISSAPASLNSSELNEQEIYHPSDCSLAPSTSSSCSSSD